MNTAREVIIDNFTEISNDLKRLVPLEDIAKKYSIKVDTFTYRIRECYPLDYKAYLSYKILKKRKKGISQVYNVKKNIEDVYNYLYLQNLLLIDYRNKKSVSLEEFCKYVLSIKDEFGNSDIEREIMQLFEREEALDNSAVPKNNQQKYKKEKLKTEKSVEKVAEQEPVILDSTIDLHSAQDSELSLDEEIALYREALAKEEESASEDLEVYDVDLNPLFRRPIPLDMTTRYETESLKFDGIEPVYQPAELDPSVVDFSVFLDWKDFTRDDAELNKMIRIKEKGKKWADLSALTPEQLMSGYVRLNSKKLRIDEKRFFVIRTESNTESKSYENLNRLGGFFNYDLIGILNRAWIKLYRYYDGELYDLNVTFDITLEHFEVEERRGLKNVGVLARLLRCK